MLASSVESSSYLYLSQYQLGVLLAIVSSLTMAIKMISRQQLIRTGVPHSVVNFQFSAFGTGAWIIYNLLRQQSLAEFNLWSLGIGLITGGLSVVVSMFYARALKNENIQILSIIGGLDIIYAVILQKIFLKQSCDTVFAAGASLIVLASLLVCSVKFMASEKRVVRDVFAVDQYCCKSYLSLDVNTEARIL